MLLTIYANQRAVISNQHIPLEMVYYNLRKYAKILEVCKMQYIPSLKKVSIYYLRNAVYTLKGSIYSLKKWQFKLLQNGVHMYVLKGRMAVYTHWKKQQHVHLKNTVYFLQMSDMPRRVYFIYTSSCHRKKIHLFVDCQQTINPYAQDSYLYV